MKIHCAISAITAIVLSLALATAQEYNATNDSDGDGWEDSYENAAYTNPNSAKSYPTPPLSVQLSGDIDIDVTTLRAEAYLRRPTNLTNGGFFVYSTPCAKFAPVYSAYSAFDPSRSGRERYQFRPIEGHLQRRLTDFWVYADLDGNGKFDVGEPAGLSLYRPTLVSGDAVDVEVALSDEIFGFPRLSWAPSTNSLINRYRVKLRANSNNQKSALDLSDLTKAIIVEAPRTYIHEGDFIDAGFKGITLNKIATDQIDWEVYAINDEWWSDSTYIESGSFLFSFLDGNGNRRTMESISPVGGNYNENAIIEFKWYMDWRTEGVFFTVNDSFGNAVEGLDNLYVPFPVCHGKHSVGDYYYTAKPQLNSGRSVVLLPPGTYTYTIKENLRGAPSSIPVQSITGSFTIQNE